MSSHLSPNRPHETLVYLSIALLVVAVQSGCAESPDGSADRPRVEALTMPAGTDAAAATIDADGLERHLVAIAADEMGGRGPGSDGDRLARRYIADLLSGLGIEPGGPDGSYEQAFNVVGITSEVPKIWSFQAADGELELDFWDDFIAASGVQEPSAAIADAEVVFVGYGIDAPEHDWDDFAGADLEGKVLLILNNDPHWDPDLFEGERRLYYGRWDYKYESAAGHGAGGAIIIHTRPSAGYPWQVVQTSWTGEQFELPAGDEPRVQIAAWVTEDGGRRLVELAGHDLDALIERAHTREFEPVALGVRTSLRLDNTISATQTANVLGLLPGSDPEMAREVVIYTAHHDHLGTGAGGGDEDRIYNGALDNAAGVAQVLAIAEAVASLPQAPSRSTLFAFVGGEESGLLGSEFYAMHPTVPAGRIAANINFDGGNRWGRTRDITYIGYGKSSLDGVVEAAAAMQDRIVLPDQFPDRGFFYRSDQFNFAKIGVPAIYFDTGTDFIGQPAGWGKERIEEWEANDYHQVTDEYDDSWNLEGMIEDARLGLYCGLAIANKPDLPTWNPGDEFEAARLAAIAAE